MLLNHNISSWLAQIQGKLVEIHFIEVLGCAPSVGWPVMEYRYCRKDHFHLLLIFLVSVASICFVFHIRKDQPLEDLKDFNNMIGCN